MVQRWCDFALLTCLGLVAGANAMGKGEDDPEAMEHDPEAMEDYPEAEEDVTKT